MNLKTYEEMNAEQQMAYDIGVATFKANLTSPETIEKAARAVDVVLHDEHNDTPCESATEVAEAVLQAVAEEDR